MGDALKRVVSRAISDAAFRRQLQADPKGALKEFDLSEAEIGALTSGDPTKLTALGIDQRMSRLVVIGGHADTFSRSDSDAGFGSRAVIDAGAGGSEVGRVASDPVMGVRGDVEMVEDATSGGAVGRHDISDVGQRLSRADIGTGTGPDGLDLDRLADDTAAASPAFSDNPYGTDRLDRIEGSDHTDLGTPSSDEPDPNWNPGAEHHA